MSSQFYIPPFNSSLTYKQFDVVYGIDIAGTTHSSPYFYATADVAAGYSPSGIYNFPITQYSRVDDVTTLTYTHTGGPAFGVGSIVKVTGVSANSTVNYTGMLVAGGSGTISFTNPGWPQTASISAGAINCLSPAWSTGFFFVPTYTSKVGTQNAAITTKLGDGYEQRLSRGLNTFDQNATWVYRDISERKMKAIVNYVQDAAGVNAFEAITPDAYLSNQPNQKWVASDVEVEPVAFKLYNVSVPMRRVFAA